MQHVPVSVLDRLINDEWRTPITGKLITVRKDFGGTAEIGSLPTYPCVQPGHMADISTRGHLTELQYKYSQSNWKQLITMGYDATFPYKRRGSVIAIDRGYLMSYAAKLNCENQDYSKRVAYTDGYMLYFPLTIYYGVPTFKLSSNLTDLKAANREKLYKKVRANYDTFNEGLFLAMGMRTIRMVSRPLSSIRDFLHGKVYPAQVFTLRKLRRNKGRKKSYFKRNKVEEALSGTWLEYNFGWNLLLNNLDDAAHDIARLNANLDREKFRERTQSKVEYRYTKNSSYSVASAAIQTAARIYETLTVNAGATQSITIPEPERLGSLSDARAFLPTIWEVIPFSWMVDYIIPIGGILDNICYHSALGLNFGYESFKHQIVIEGMYPTTSAYSGNTKVVGDPGQIVAKVVYFERSKLPIDYIKNRTSFTFPDYWKQFLNVAAVTQILNKKAYYLTH